MKQSRKYLLVALALVLVGLLATAVALAEGIIVKSVKVDLDETEYEVTNYTRWVYLSAEIETEGEGDYDLKYFSSNKDIIVSGNWLYTSIPGVTEVTVKVYDEYGKEIAKSEPVRVTFKEIPITGLVYDEASYGNPYEIQINSDFDLDDDMITVLPADATYANDGFIWSTKDTGIIRVSKNGHITALKIGEATLTATSKGSAPKSVDIKVKVISNPVEAVTFTPNAFTLKCGRGFYFGRYMEVTPEDAHWSYVRQIISSDPEVVEIDSDYDDYYLYTRRPGSATITVVLANADDTFVEGTFTVTVEDNPITSLKFSKDSYKMKIGSGHSFGKNMLSLLTIKPYDAVTVFDGDSDLEWSSSDMGVAYVDQSGYVTAKAPGSATITVKCLHDESITASATLTVEPIAISKLTMKKDTLTFAADTTDPDDTTTNRVEFRYEPSDAYIDEYTWTVSDQSIAYIGSCGIDDYYDRAAKGSSGGGTGYAYLYWNGNKVGTITVSCKVNDSKKDWDASCTVTFTKNSPDIYLTNEPDSDEAVTKAVVPLYKNNKKWNKNVTTFWAFNNKNSYNYDDVEWTSSDPSVLSIDRAGRVTTIKAGTATITATLRDGSGKSASCAVTVKLNKVKKLTANKTITLKVGDKVNINSYIDATTTIADYPIPDLSKILKYKLKGDVASVNNKGVVWANKPGTATLNITAKDGSKKKLKITIKVVEATN